ncbi:tRNA lysidine(34) synthetase TilS [Picosynechococcus sp. PCC 8807]|uniref:tRNA lysidine(34) synthetase TilS n=1 Tax=Picosynechococcus sp. PCC 8807 TaxID=195248 RepID=UPI0008105917|nr:tRNA lysidine(34) synthetase TilS [Picosynechococcus sp. PCC 8807]ANV90919.1 tRNA lysidine(34) synthetase TilS [Picosynechococcus sp. PCC 8807]
MNWSPLHARLHQHLKESNLLPAGAKLIMAVSGGQDSVCLSRLMLDLQRHWQWSLAIAHCHHGWPGDEEIAAHVQTLGAQWQLPFYLCRAASSLPETENAARRWRYDTLTHLAEQLDQAYVVTGHTQSDRAETLIYNLVRGAGTAGLGSLTERRSLSNKVKLVRPLLTITRQETGEFCRQFNLPVCLDPFNQQMRFKRNQIRQQILPHLRTLNTQADKHLAQTALILQDENDYLEAIAQQYLQQALTPQQHLHRLVLQPLHIALQRRIIRQYLQQVLPKMPTFAQISATVELLHGCNGDRLSTLPGKIQLQVMGEWLVPEALKSNLPKSTNNQDHYPPQAKDY